MLGMRKLAALTGLSVATISRALRGDSSVTEKTRALVLSVAQQSGYEFNPYVGQLMSAMRRRQGESMKGNLALLWYDVFPRKADWQLKQVQANAIERADELGYCLEEFNLCQYEPGRLLRVMRNRGIRGVLISIPVKSSGKVHLRLRLDEFSCVSLGWSIYSPAFNRVRFDHFEAIRLAMHNAKRQAGSSVAGLIDCRYDRRADGLFRAGFLAHHPGGSVAAKKLFFDLQKLDIKKFRQEYEKGRFRVLITQARGDLPEELREWLPKENIIYLDEQIKLPCLGVVSYRYDLLGRWGVDLLVSTVQGNEKGVPAIPKTLFVPPQWIPFT